MGPLPLPAADGSCPGCDVIFVAASVARRSHDPRSATAHTDFGPATARVAWPQVS
jgi:hypothetical protein